MHLLLPLLLPLFAKALLSDETSLSALLREPPLYSLLTKAWPARRSARLPRQVEGSGDLPDVSEPDEERPFRQTEDTEDEDTEGSLDCTFGSDDVGDLCDYANPENASLKWMASTGTSGNWLGGPLSDGGGVGDGGYAFFETSTMPGGSSEVNVESAMLESGRRRPTGPNGQCIRFQYNMMGVSVDRLRMLLHPISEEEKQGGAVDHRDDHVIWSNTQPDSDWQQAQHFYNYGREHTIVFEAIPMKGTEREYRGHIAIDSVRAVNEDQCSGHCTFDGGICTWRQDTDDDFQWSLGRGSTSVRTGPIKDHGREMFGGIAGGYAFVDSTYPRRPGDRARLLSPEFEATTRHGPLCFTFWTHMFGPGVGTLRVLRLVGSDEKTLWELSGSSGQQWHQGQVPVSATDRFTLAVEAELSQHHQGDIAIDDVSFRPAVCPGLPQTAAVGSMGCTFEHDMCGWTNTDSRDSMRRRWEQVTARIATLPHVDHTLRTERGHVARLRSTNPQRSGDKGQLVSPHRMATNSVQCMTFWFFMDELIPSVTGPRLGSLRVRVRYEDDDGEQQTMLLWQVNNAPSSHWMSAQLPIAVSQDHQIILEGMWGGNTRGAIAVDDIVIIDGDCEQRPGDTAVGVGDCDFSADSCGWRNTTTEGSQQRWRAAGELSRPARLNDHTFRTGTGYLYFDVFSPTGRRLQLRLQSPVLDLQRGDGDRRACVSFWYATLTPTQSARLRLLYEPVSDDKGDTDEQSTAGDERVVWSLRALDTDAPRLTWLYGQADVSNDQRFRVIFEGSASNLGFALDDITFRSGSCRVRPAAADPTRDTTDEEEEEERAADTRSGRQ